MFPVEHKPEVWGSNDELDSDRLQRTDRTCRPGPDANEPSTRSGEYAALPAGVETLETEHQRLQHEVASPEFYKSPREHIESVLARTEAVALELEQALERWIELEEIAR
jgi:hypothetical protein